jgi:hypothetical protein
MGHAILAFKNARQPRKTGFLPSFPDFFEIHSIVSGKRPIMPIILPIFPNIAILHGNGIQKANNTQGMLLPPFPDFYSQTIRCFTPETH